MISQKRSKQVQKYGDLNDAPMPVLIAAGKDLTVVYANEKGLGLMHSAPVDVIGSRLHDLFPTIFSQETAHNIYKKCFSEGSSYIMEETQVIVPGGNPKIFWYKITINPVRDESGTPNRVILFFSEVSDQLIARTANDPREPLAEIDEPLLARIAKLNETQTVLQQLVDSSIEYIAVVDRDLRFMIVNKPMEKFINKSRGELIGKHIFEAYGGARGSGQVAGLERALAGEIVRVRINPSISRPNVWFDTHYVPLVINERVEGVISLSRDISDIVKSEQELADVNRQLAEAQRLARLGSWEWDVATGNVLWSDEMYRIYGYDEKFAVDFVRATERMSPEDAEKSSRRTQQHIQLAMDHFRQTGQTVFEISSVEFPIRLPDGEQKIVRNSGKIQLTADGKLHRILGVVQDVTHIRSAEEQLRILVSELELKNKELESFNYVASHDLQEPLRKIQTFIDRIRNGALDQRAVDDHLLRINNSARRMHDLIQSMLTLSRLSSPGDGFTDVDLNVVLANCTSDLELVIREKDARIESDVLPIVTASAFQMSQLFGNLISNALKFSHERPLVRITCNRVMGAEIEQFKADNDKPYWCLSFIDNGIGFDSKFKEQIFDLFQRLHSKSEFAGTGIGLSIVKRIAERHRGFIEASSEQGKGARFSVWLPCL
jgi:PAS domain S-box-containing protein